MDSAFGSSFADHVMGGYRFLMRYYSVGDDLYFFGFSRGAYTARFLAEMLDHVGVLSAGNEELVHFAWKTYAKWASRTAEEKEQEEKLYEFMRGFRETFSRPVRRIRFLGLFDTVNSVPRFESAWMKRSFPYTARSSAKVIRHAVAIDERRARFRQDLISGDQVQHEDIIQQTMHRYNSDLGNMDLSYNTAEIDGRRRSRLASVHAQHARPEHIQITEREVPGSMDSAEKTIISDDRSEIHLLPLSKTLSLQPRHDSVDTIGLAVPMGPEVAHLQHEEDAAATEKRNHARRRQFSDELKQKQDIQEVWFPGCHADIGGGFTRADSETWMLSHAPLVWMVQEASKAGLEFDPIKMARANCHPDGVDEYGDRYICEDTAERFHSALSDSYINGLIHDCLVPGHGVSKSLALGWNICEYLPFRRMDLQEDGTWKAIIWPLPMGETRDIPQNAEIHHSAIKRMQKNPNYRPGNLIVGGGGRGVRRAPEKYGIGQWTKHKKPEDLVGETYVRADLASTRTSTMLVSAKSSTLQPLKQ